MDFVLEHRRRVLPIEVKASRQARSADAAGIERLMADHAGARFGLVIYAGDDVAPLSAHVVAAPVHLFL